jgi:hypothetical protein
MHPWLAQHMGDLLVKHLGCTVGNTIRGILTLVSNKQNIIKKTLLGYGTGTH